MFNFVKRRYWFFLMSAIIIVPGLISLASAGFNLGIDFQSGSSMTLHFSTDIDTAELRSALADLGHSEAIVQRTGEDDFIVRMSEIDTTENQELISGLDTHLETTTEQKDLSVISATVASQTARNALISVLVASIGILLYITYAFRKMPNPVSWGVCAVIALIHDALVVAGIFSILGWAAGIEIDSLFITGMLTVVGYSVHDTIVVFDRLRENLLKSGSARFEDVVNSSIMQTMTRSLNTSLTVLFVLFSLLLLGGSTLRDFTLVLIIGIITGTYSSICIASQLLVVWENKEWKRFTPFLKKKNA
jgi:preprotein translocase subunit SecF